VTLALVALPGFISRVISTRRRAVLTAACDRAEQNRLVRARQPMPRG